MDSDGLAMSVRGRKSIALLGYLVLTHPQLHSRERLAGLFWPELPDKDARNNLRVTLARINKKLGSDQAPALITDRLTATYCQDAKLFCDAHEFQRLLTGIEAHEHDDPVNCTHCYDNACHAASLYTAEFMQGFQLDDCMEFEEWQLATREQLKGSAIEILNTIGQAAVSNRDYIAAVQQTRKLLKLDAYQEQAHRRLMSALTRSGDRHAALTHFAQMKTLLKEELGVDPDAETLAIYQAIKNGELDADSPVNTVTPNRLPDNQSLHNLPIEKSSYIGNQATLEQLINHIHEQRLITVTGIGGVGKTRLAVQAGRGLLSAFAGGVWFLRLSPLNTRTELVSSLASVLSVELLPGDDPISSIANQLNTQNRLLILDNFEHILDARDVVSSLLERVQNVKIIVTSRQRLQLTEEAVFPVLGLSYSTSTNVDTVAPNDDASELFIDTAQRIQLDFTVSAHNRTAINRISRLVKGHPLALVIAASWVDGLSCQQIAEELERGLGILEIESSDVPERQRSVRATFNYSWTMLDHEEQCLFAALSVFRGGFDRQAAMQISGASLQQLTRLVRKSLLQHLPDQNRYDMHELMRQYAEEQLRSLGNTKSVTQAHCDHFLSRLNEIASGQFDDNAIQQKKLFNTDFDNIRKAWYFALATEQQERLTDAISGLRIMCSLGSHSHVLLDLLQPALPLISNPDNDQSQKELVLNLLLALGFAYRYTKGYFAPELDDIFARAYALTDQLDTSPELFVVLYGRWSFNFTRANLADNLTILAQWRERLSQFDETPVVPGYIKDARFVVAMLEGPQLQSMGAISEGREIMLSGLKLENSASYAAMMGHYGLNFAVSGRHWLAINQCISGLLDQSIKTIEQAHAIAERENNPYLQMFVAFGQLLIYTLRKDVTQIVRHANTVNALVSEHRIFKAFQHHAKVYSAYAQSYDDANTGAEQMQLLVDSGMGIPVFHLFDAQLLADALVRGENPAQAIETIHRFSPPAVEKQLLINISESERIKGDALVALGKPDDAVKYYESALSIAKKQEAGLYLLSASRAYATCLAKLNKTPRAIALLTAAVDSFIEGCDTSDYTESKAQIALWKNPRTDSPDVTQ